MSFNHEPDPAYRRFPSSTAISVATCSRASSSSGLALSPLNQNDNFLVDSLSTASGLAERPPGFLVDSLSEPSGLLPSPRPAETAPKG